MVTRDVFNNQEVMSKENQNKNSQQTPKDTKTHHPNPIENYFASPDATKKRKKSMDSSSNKTPPPKRVEGEKKEHEPNQSSPRLVEEEKNSKKEQKSPPKTSTMTPNSDKVCKHLDTQLTDMEKRLETSLSASLSASITASITAGLKGLIDDSLKTALETMTKTVNDMIDEHLTIKHHGEQLDSLETENIILKNKVSRIEGENSKMKQRLANIESRALQHNIILRGVLEEDWEKESTTKSKVYTELAYLVSPEQTIQKELMKRNF